MGYSLGLAVILAIIWLSNSGIYTPLILSFGVLSIILVLWIVKRMSIVDRESVPLQLLTPRLLTYYGWLLGQIALSNIDVARRVWSGNINPTVGDIPTQGLSDMGKVIYANSITLTPGTVVMDILEDNIRVHAISRDGIENLLSGKMEHRIRRLGAGGS